MISRIQAPLQKIYRSLPIGIRLPIGRVARALLEPSLAAKLPRAVQSDIRPARSAQIAGLFSSTIGHGAAARLLAIEIEAAGLECGRRDLSAALRAPREGAFENVETTTDAAVILVMNPDTTIQALSRTSPNLTRGRRTIGYWVWETSTPPANWRRASELVHEIWTPSRFSADAIAQRLGRSVSVVPHPVALSPPPLPTIERRLTTRAALGVGPDTFVALQSFHFPSCAARKNPFDALRAFEKAFGSHGDAVLVIRVSGGEYFPRARRSLQEAIRNTAAKVKLIEPAMGLTELHDLYAASDCYLSLHRSEGFGLNLAEAMLSRRAVVATAWSGNMDFMDEATAALVPAKLVPVVDPQGIYTEGLWAEPSVEVAVAQLRRLASDTDYRANIALAGEYRCRALLSGGTAASLLLEPAASPRTSLTLNDTECSTHVTS